ncbi:hypothetical protein K458DRAFT_176744 [Lentithecium fluviatile CBS 122367]|uniref:Uncharacterized protein n=1 Tax=Lentithecium fluviatile CBS 122367 TaxID=1168545 RepID=A0A6G1JDH3_9PLEO|nr:hypothetical protein K458DRAFT_176744 [Lentithecium fluviatile CBS 122367]
MYSTKTKACRHFSLPVTGSDSSDQTKKSSAEVFDSRFSDRSVQSKSRIHEENNQVARPKRTAGSARTSSASSLSDVSFPSRASHSTVSLASFRSHCRNSLWDFINITSALNRRHSFQYRMYRKSSHLNEHLDCGRHLCAKRSHISAALPFSAQPVCTALRQVRTIMENRPFARRGGRRNLDSTIDTTNRTTT